MRGRKIDGKKTNKHKTSEGRLERSPSLPSFPPRTISLTPHQVNAALYYLNVWNGLFSFSYKSETKASILAAL